MYCADLDDRRRIVRAWVVKHKILIQSLPWVKGSCKLESIQLLHGEVNLPSQDYTEAVCGIASLEAAVGKGWRGEEIEGEECEDDDVVGACGSHCGHGVDGARRLGFNVPGDRREELSKVHVAWRIIMRSYCKVQISSVLKF
uniref:Uncharacterized protein n=1 Tax=Oryza barthii TaxID=65489 RepID=A0A0D3GNN2_9ORYZ